MICLFRRKTSQEIMTLANLEVSETTGSKNGFLQLISLFANCIKNHIENIIIILEEDIFPHQ